jgi:hypothetical protein
MSESSKGPTKADKCATWLLSDTGGTEFVCIAEPASDGPSTEGANARSCAQLEPEKSMLTIKIAVALEWLRDIINGSEQSVYKPNRGVATSAAALH